jgi:serine/threonine-protein kinase HipA
MNKCPISYAPCKGKYSEAALVKFSPRLKTLADLPYTAQEQRREAAVRSTKMSVQGFQAKLSAKLSLKEQALEIVDSHGTYIIKPQSDIYKELPENEALTMNMAKLFGIEVPFSGLIYSKDASLSYFVKRFDRYANGKKRALEDFAQLTENTRDTKYNFTMEKLIPVIDLHCSFPLLEKRKLFRRVLFCFVTGNEDMHLKNFSLLRRDNKIALSPAYDLLNTTISMKALKEELALPLAGKKAKLKREDFVDYFAAERLKLTDKTISSELQNLSKHKSAMENLIRISFLSANMQKAYLELLSERMKRLLGT